ncbi:biotin--protein ligase [Diaphorina citri]|uniref:Biotin--protein ligase n=1 Tax=Diaphorina citri TaxID=121845 RepID=A0A3Q0IMG1_DIACI|nr:biotin--protein ligase [Diaphorina citri]
MVIRSQVLKMVYTAGYLIGHPEAKTKLLDTARKLYTKKTQSVVQMKKMELEFCQSAASRAPSEAYMPILVNEAPSDFNVDEYYRHLNTKKLGQLVIYSGVMSSSHNVLDGPTLLHGLTVIPRQQTQGTGRSNNIWLSPPGCAMFSMQLHIDLKSQLGKHLPLIQHIVAISIVLAVKSFNQDIDLGIKWPNDLYVNGNVKLGGIIVTSSILSTFESQMAVCNIGVGMNLDNSQPTTCLNSIFSANPSSPLLSYEQYFALVFNHLEQLMEGDFDEIYDLYYKHWLHNNVNVTVVSERGEAQQVKIIGIDDFGFLNVRSEEGYIFSVRPDGNTFDMLNGLIAPKQPTGVKTS